MDWTARGIGLRIGGHRGSSASAPENTYAAFEQAHMAGALYVETDIRRTVDGALVLMHDDTVDRTTDGHGPVAALSLADVRRLDAGAWYGDEYRGQRVPELGDFLDWIEEGPPMGAALEVKADGIGAIVAEGAWRSAARGRLAIYSFLPDEIRAAKKSRVDCPCVLLLRLSDDPASVIDRIEECGADGADVPWQWNARDLIASMRQRGMIIGGGSANGDGAARVLLETGVDMIDTDDPAAMIATVHAILGKPTS